jgi:hypothetical protein
VERNVSDVSALTIHFYVGILVVLMALLAIWRRPDRRYTLYVVTLQIVLGIGVLFMGLRAPWYHIALAVVGWSGYMVANAVGRRPGKEALGVVIAIVSSLLIIAAFGIGRYAVHGS